MKNKIFVNCTTLGSLTHSAMCACISANYLPRKYNNTFVNEFWMTKWKRKMKVKDLGWLSALQYGFRGISISGGVLTITFQSESEKTTAGILKTASRALVETHAHSVSAGIFRNHVKPADKPKPMPLPLKLWVTIVIQSESKCLLFGSKLKKNLRVKFPLSP